MGFWGSILGSHYFQFRETTMQAPQEEYPIGNATLVTWGTAIP